MKTIERKITSNTIGKGLKMNAVAVAHNRDRLANKAIEAHNARLLREKRRERALAAKTA